jgi:hypothetical protein
MHKTATISGDPNTSNHGHQTLILASVYIINLVVLMVPHLIWTSSEVTIPSCAPPFVYGKNLIFTLRYMYIVYLVPHLTMNVMYVWLMIQVLRYQKKLSHPQRPEAVELESLSPVAAGVGDVISQSDSMDGMTRCVTYKCHIQAVVTIGIVVLIHDVLSTPAIVVGLGLSFGGWNKLLDVGLVTRAMWISNSVVNPVIYALRIKPLRRILYTFKLF